MQRVGVRLSRFDDITLQHAMQLQPGCKEIYGLGT
jgi:hypothetical protein